VAAVGRAPQPLKPHHHQHAPEPSDDRFLRRRHRLEPTIIRFMTKTDGGRNARGEDAVTVAAAAAAAVAEAAVMSVDDGDDDYADVITTSHSRRVRARACVCV